MKCIYVTTFFTDVSQQEVYILDVLTDAHADTLLLSLTIYISRRGCPKQISTDNGPVFALSKVHLFAAK